MGYLGEHRELADNDNLFMGVAVVLSPIMYPLWLVGKLFNRKTTPKPQLGEKK